MKECNRALADVYGPQIQVSESDRFFRVHCHSQESYEYVESMASQRKGKYPLAPKLVHCMVYGDHHYEATYPHISHY